MTKVGVVEKYQKHMSMMSRRSKLPGDSVAFSVDEQSFLSELNPEQLQVLNESITLLNMHKFEETVKEVKQMQSKRRKLNEIDKENAYIQVNKPNFSFGVKPLSKKLERLSISKEKPEGVETKKESCSSKKRTLQQISNVE